MRTTKSAHSTRRHSPRRSGARQNEPHEHENEMHQDEAHRNEHRNRTAAPPDGPGASTELSGPVVEDEMYEGLRVKCPECRQAIAVFTHEEKLPRHGRCASPWDPFGLTMCQGSGCPVQEATPWDSETRERDVSELLTLPEGLDWRTQPFSHAGRPDHGVLRIGVK